MRLFSPSRPGGQAAHAARWFTSYGRRAGWVQVLTRRIVSAVVVVAVLLAGYAGGARAEGARPLRSVALGVSLVAGYGLRAA
ncbi:MAG: hypothetical protein WB820_20720, partial [Rhodoplanes sp.]